MAYLTRKSWRKGDTFIALNWIDSNTYESEKEKKIVRRNKLYRKICNRANKVVLRDETHGPYTGVKLETLFRETWRAREWFYIIRIVKKQNVPAVITEVSYKALLRQDGNTNKPYI